ncbi:hypothetical protein C7B69_10845 [filamentous cyanobacterium Phorm 46]|nr:hypothetical protein C7B69_10845 [filamentous cyanobacterium Phorm 46]
MCRVLGAIAPMYVRPALCGARRALGVKFRSMLKFPRLPVYQALAPANMLLALRIATHNYLWALRQKIEAKKILLFVT